MDVHGLVEPFNPVKYIFKMKNIYNFRGWKHQGFGILNRLKMGHGTVNFGMYAAYYVFC
jgi:hypothetical protein